MTPHETGAPPGALGRDPYALSPATDVRRPPPRRDTVLLVLLTLLNLGSAYTTLLGARQVLPWPMSDVLGVTIQAMLFLTLAGFAVRHAPVRRWLVVTVFAAASIYTSFFTYYAQLAGGANAASDLDRAHQAHATFVDALWQPATTRVAREEQAAKELQALAEREAGSGVTSGVKGFGPVARGYAEQARVHEATAARLAVDLERLAPAFTYDLDGLDASGIYARDLAAWQAAPTDWKEAVPAPTRAGYVDLEQQIELLTPYWKVSRGELPAVAALLLALLVDGLSVLLGTAIHAGGRPLLDQAARHTAGQIATARAGAQRVRQAWLKDPRTPEAESALDDALRVVVLRIAGRGSAFLTAVYQAIDPETGALDFAALQRAEDPSWRLGARMLADRLRAPQLGWLTVRDGYWQIPAEAYPTVSTWLADHLRRELEREAEDAVDRHLDGERTLKLLLPAA